MFRQDSPTLLRHELPDFAVLSFEQVARVRQNVEFPFGIFSKRHDVIPDPTVCVRRDLECVHRPFLTAFCSDINRSVGFDPTPRPIRRNIPYKAAN